MGAMLTDVLGVFGDSEESPDALAALAADQVQVLPTMRPGENLSAFVCLCSYGQTAAADGRGVRGHCDADVFAILEHFVERMAVKLKTPTPDDSLAMIVELVISVKCDDQDERCVRVMCTCYLFD